MNASGNNPGIIERLVTALNIRGDVSQDVKGLLPSIALLNIDNPEYWARQTGGRLMEGSVDLPAVAGQQAFAHLANADPSIMAIVERVEVTNFDAAVKDATLGIAVIQGTYSVAGSKAGRDDRQPVVGTATPLSAFTPVGGNSAAPTGMGGHKIHLPPGITSVFTGPWILTGNLSLELLTDTVNWHLTVSYVWRERRKLPSEK